VQFLKFGDWSLDFRLLVWTNRPRLHAQIRSDINYRIERLFREAGIEIPFPQTELRVREGAGTDRFTGRPARRRRDVRA
jgi:small-conductance mechanosensitive channel